MATAPTAIYAWRTVLPKASTKVRRDPILIIPTASTACAVTSFVLIRQCIWRKAGWLKESADAVLCSVATPFTLNAVEGCATLFL
jgi:hypothetical protein